MEGAHYGRISVLHVSKQIIVWSYPWQQILQELSDCTMSLFFNSGASNECKGYQEGVLHGGPASSLGGEDIVELNYPLFIPYRVILFDYNTPFSYK